MTHKQQEITIQLELIKLSRGYEGDSEALSKELAVPKDSIVTTMVFRKTEGYLQIIAPVRRLVDFIGQVVLKEKIMIARMDNADWYFLTKGVNKKNAEKLKNNPFVLAADSRIETIVDSKILDNKEVVILIGNNQAIKTKVPTLVVGTRARVISETTY